MPARLVAWVGGVVLVVLASSPWLERLAERTFTGHMVQHLIVIIVAAPLLVLARPIHTAMMAGWIPADGARPAGRRRVAPLRRRSSARRLFVVVLFVTHLTSIYDRALDDRWLHEAEHVAYLLERGGDVGGRARRRPRVAVARIGVGVRRGRRRGAARHDPARRRRRR